MSRENFTLDMFLDIKYVFGHIFGHIFAFGRGLDTILDTYEHLCPKCVRTHIVLQHRETYVEKRWFGCEQNNCTLRVGKKQGVAEPF